MIIRDDKGFTDFREEIEVEKALLQDKDNIMSKRIQYTSYSTFGAELLSSGEETVISLRNDRTYYQLTITKTDKWKVVEKFPSFLSINDFILFIADEERREYIKYLEEEFFEGKTGIDYDLIDFWKSELKHFLSKINQMWFPSDLQSSGNGQSERLARRPD